MSNVLSPRDLVSRHDNMDETVLHRRWSEIDRLSIERKKKNNILGYE